MAAFAEILKEARGAMELTQAELATKSGIPLRTIQEWEAGCRPPVCPDFFNLLKALGCSVDLFAGVTEGEGK